MTFRIVDGDPDPILGPKSPGAEAVRFGFEGGRALKLGTTYHLFISEMVDEPKFVKTRLAHWTSGDGARWRRQSTLFESSGEFDGRDPRAALFLPQPVFDAAAGRWNLFYAAFRAAPNAGRQWRLNHDGRIWRAVSRRTGAEGIGGPYDDAGIVLQPGTDQDAWEGLQGTDSFFPYEAGERWYAFYGSARTETWPCASWAVGLATAPALAGPWTRCSTLNPVRVDQPFIENPVVTRWPDATYVAVYDAVLHGRAIGWSVSRDGIGWSTGRRIALDGPLFDWLRQTRTPLGLIPRDERTAELFFTGEDQGGYRCMSRVTLRQEA